MQYWQRRLQRSVTDSRRLASGRWWASRTGTIRRSYRQINVAAVQVGEQSEQQGEVCNRVKERRDVRRPDWQERRLVYPAAKRHPGLRPLQIDQRLREQSGQHEQQDRVASERDERLGDATGEYRLARVAEPVAHCEARRRETAREQDVRARPQVLVDRQPQARDEAEQDA